MADPFTLTMAAVSIGSTIAGGVMSAEGASAKGEADAQMATYKAGVAKLNADINRQNADWALQAGEANQARSGMNTGFTIARQKSTQAASGIDVNTGSAAQVRESTRKVGQIDQQTIRTQAEREAIGFRNRAKGADAEAGGHMMAAGNARTAADYAVAGSILGTAGSVASKWTQASQVFGTGSGSVMGSGYHNSGDSADAYS